MRNFQRGFNSGLRLEWNDRYKTIAIIVVCIVAVVAITMVYSNAYNNSAEALTILVQDKWINHHTDEDGFTTTSYAVIGNGEELNCGSWGKQGSAIFHRLHEGERYEVVVAGLGIARRDIVAINRHIPKPKPAPVLIRESEPEAE